MDVSLPNYLNISTFLHNSCYTYSGFARIHAPSATINGFTRAMVKFETLAYGVMFIMGAGVQEMRVLNTIRSGKVFFPDRKSGNAVEACLISLGLIWMLCLLL
jgi:hypothetical protein